MTGATGFLGKSEYGNAGIFLTQMRIGASAWAGCNQERSMINKFASTFVATFPKRRLTDSSLLFPKTKVLRKVWNVLTTMNSRVSSLEVIWNKTLELRNMLWLVKQLNLFHVSKVTVIQRADANLEKRVDAAKAATFIRVISMLNPLFVTFLSFGHGCDKPANKCALLTSEEDPKANVPVNLMCCTICWLQKLT